jgi:HK97 family phage major capsid protein
MTGVTPLTVSNVPSGLLPPEVTGPIFTRTVQMSAVMRLARRVPLAIDRATSVPVPGDVPIADWVSQASAKPLATGSVGIKQMTGQKVACLVPVAEEVVATNAGGLYDQLEQDLPVAIARAFDQAAIHGITMSGAPGPFAEALVSSTNSQAIGASSQATGGYYADLVKGMEQVVDLNWEFNGFAADQRLRPKLMLATDTQGRPIFVGGTMPTESGHWPELAPAGTLIGEPVAWSRSVSGLHYRQSTATDTGVRAIGGDWSQCAYGVGRDITIRVSDQASWVDGTGTMHSAFQENVVLLLVEAILGFVTGDVNAFVTYVDEGVTSA